MFIVEVLSNPPNGYIFEETVEEPCLVRFKGNVGLESNGVKSIFQGDTSDRMFDVPCDLKFSYICAIDSPSAVDTQIDLMTKTDKGPWPSCIWAQRMFAPVYFCSFSNRIG